MLCVELVSQRIFHLILNVNLVTVDCVLSIALHNIVVSVVHGEIIFHVELNISVVSVVNNELIFNVVLEISVVSVFNYHHYEHALLEMYFSRNPENQRSQCSQR